MKSNLVPASLAQFAQLPDEAVVSVHTVAGIFDAGTFGVNLMPQAIGPIFEQAANRNSFTKAPIETPGMANEQPFLRAKPGTSETLRQAGMATRNMPESIQVNPVRAEAFPDFGDAVKVAESRCVKSSITFVGFTRDDSKGMMGGNELEPYFSLPLLWFEVCRPRRG
jgi:hypothetical protein